MSDKIKRGGAAFPGPNAEFVGIGSDGQERYDIQPGGGMTLRDYFAAKAMQSLYSSRTRDYSIGLVARKAYKVADEMLEARDEYTEENAEDEMLEESGKNE